MRVLVAAGTWSPERNGVARVAVETARELARRGHDLTVLAPRADATATEADEEGLRVLRGLVRGRLPLLLTDVTQSRRVARGLREQFDVVLAHGSMLTTGIGRSGIAAPIACVYHASLPRELRFAASRLPRPRTRLASGTLAPVASVLDRAALRAARTVLVLSDYSGSLLEDDHGSPGTLAKVRRVSGGVDVSSFAPADGPGAARERLHLPAEAELVVSVRRAEPRMGLELLLEAAAVLAARRPRLLLVVAGGGDLEPRLRELARDLGVDARTRFLGRVTEHALRDLYRAADVFALPTVAYEGFGMVTAEALASATPVVGTPVGATPELLRPLDPALVAERADVEALTAAIDRVLSLGGPELRNRCRAYAVERFAWERAILPWEEALAEIAGT
jgi:glycosyltransferase involved in cell wall biosynthesis